jgi:hypothetical protein
MAGVSLKSLDHMLKGVVLMENIVRAVPLPPVKDHAGVTVLTPAHSAAVEYFGRLGIVVPVEDEIVLAKLCVITCMMGSYYQLLDTCHSWLVENGVNATQASAYVGAQFASIALDGKHAGMNGQGFKSLISEQTPGGFNEMGIRELREAGVWDEVSATLTSIDARWQGKATFSELRPSTARAQAMALAEKRIAEAESKAKEVEVLSSAKPSSIKGCCGWSLLAKGAVFGLVGGLAFAAGRFSVPGLKK